MKVLLATEKPFAATAVAQIQKIVEDGGNQFVKLEKYTDKSQLLDAVKDANAIIIRSDIIDAEVMNAAPELKIVVRAGAGYDNVDLPAATEKGIVVMNTPGQNSNAVAELVFGMLVYLNRNQFNGTSGTELKGKKLGLLAFGNVSRNVVRVAKGFDMEVYAYDNFVKREVMEASGVHYIASPAELFKTCDVVSLHIPKTPETVKSINEELLMSMPKGAFLINTARKEVIDEQGVYNAMKQREDLHYATDILPDNDAAMKEFGVRYFSTPKKMGAQTSEANINAGLAAANQINNFFATGNETFRVNK